jgi:hypothetical protein
MNLLDNHFIDITFKYLRMITWILIGERLSVFMLRECKDGATFICQECECVSPSWQD